MSLFAQNSTDNVLPRDGTVYYFGCIFGVTEATTIYQNLLDTIPWQHDEAVIFGRHIVTARKVAWVADAGYSYTYSRITRNPVPWSPELRALKSKVESCTNASFNSCLLNLYHNGDEGMGWHSDDEKELTKDGAIASLSFGAERSFSFRHKQSHETVSLKLQHGSLLVMQDTTQTHWLHSLPKTKKVKTPRINLTFRRIAQQLNA
jgi:hypothetical protein